MTLEPGEHATVTHPQETSRRFVLAALAAAVALAACGGGGGGPATTGTGTPATATPGQGAAGTQVDACAVLTLQDASAALNGAQLVQQGSGGNACSYATRPDVNPLQLVTLTVTPKFKETAGDFQQFAQRQAGFAGEGVTVEPVNGVGDEALGIAAGTTYTLNIRRGDTVITLTVTGAPNPAAAARAMGQRAASRV